jgi:TonB family protein
VDLENRAIPHETPDELSVSKDAEERGEGQDAGRPGERNGIDDGTGKKSGPDIGTDDYAYDTSRTPGLVPPVLVSRIEPVYPEYARKMHQEGVVVLQAVIDSSGLVVNLRVVKSAGEMLDSAAIAAVEKWIYRPATLNGRTVNVYLSVSVDFKLH